MPTSLPTLICLGDKAGQVTAGPDSPLSAKQHEMVEGPLAWSLHLRGEKGTFLLRHQCGCGSGLKREIQIPCVAMELFRALMVRCSSSLEMDSYGLADSHWSTCFHECPLKCHNLSALSFSSLSGGTIHCASCGSSCNHAVYLHL